MPIYEYECEACGHTLDALQKMSDAPLKDCPACGKPALRKRVSAPRFRLKGGGWYETDFKQGNRRNIAEAGDAGGEKKSGAAEARPESAAKTEKKTGGESTGSGTTKSSTSSSDA